MREKLTWVRMVEIGAGVLTGLILGLMGGARLLANEPVGQRLTRRQLFKLLAITTVGGVVGGGAGAAAAVQTEMKEGD